MKRLYLVLSALGLISAYFFFGRFIILDGLDLRLLVSQPLAGNVSTMLTMDLLICVIVSWAFIYRQARALQMRRWWLYVIATLGVGLSFALPLFLYFRETRLEELAIEGAQQ